MNTDPVTRTALAPHPAPPPELRALPGGTELMAEEQRILEAARAGENRFLYGVLSIVTSVLLVGLGWFALKVSSTYGDAIAKLMEAQTDIDTWNRNVLLLGFARAQDFGLVKGGALLLSFLVVVLGIFIVVRGTQTTYRLRLTHGQSKSALETSSPGLVMVTLGLLLAFGVVQSQSTVQLQQDPGVDARSGDGVPRRDTGPEDYDQHAGSPLPGKGG